MDVLSIFFQNVEDIFNKVKTTQVDKIRKAGAIVAKSLKDDGILHAFGTGHSHMVAEEIVYRAGGLAPVNAIMEPSLTGHEQLSKSEFTERMEGWGKLIVDYHRLTPPDVLIVISNSGRNAAPIEVAWEGQKRGVSVISILSREHSTNVTSRHSSGKKLYDVSDLIIDNCGVLGDAGIKLEGMKVPIGPTSNISAMFIIHSIVISAVSEMLKQGIEPPVFLSGNLDEGKSHNSKILEKYWGRIKIW